MLFARLIIILFPVEHACFFIVAVRAMLAAALAAVAAFEVILFGEHNVAFIAHVVIIRVEVRSHCAMVCAKITVLRVLIQYGNVSPVTLWVQKF